MTKKRAPFSTPTWTNTSAQKPTVALFKCTTGPVMYVRFTIPSDPERLPNGGALGIFRAARHLADDCRFNVWQEAWLKEDFKWFNNNLRTPDDVRSGRAVSWFRPEARDMISRVWRLAKLIESIGVPVRVLRSRDPGLIVYRDEFQVAAVRWRMAFVR
jgi:hypothetical protein